ncbi:hypothetical protein V494_04389 [Pseudogymnoascus sp. VKM F-4513 (FW-928)]|nr:hypothetical protein V494_04389 [Pseudogymnoascus sp. VKM F-4513 (FW-928)]
MRRISVSLPTRNSQRDPHEKLARYGPPPGASTLKTKIDSVKTAWMTQSQRSRYLKTGGILLFIVFLFYYLAPKGVHVGSASNGVSNEASKGASNDASKGASNAEVTVADPTTCTKSSDPSKPLKQFVLMIDAGSTGSRIHVYRFNNCGATPYLEDEAFKMTPKVEGGSSGLSAYGDDPEAAAKSLDMLMDVAMSYVPENLRGCSPVAVKATAGLRKLGDAKSDKILAAVRTRLETKYPFPVVSDKEGGVEVMEGTDEGVYAWITTNYLLDKIGSSEKKPTAATFDLGGGSTQIVFEPMFKAGAGGVPEKMAPGNHKYDLEFGGRHFELYQHSHMGYGLMESRNSIHKLVINGLLASKPADKAWLKKPIVNPCIAPGMTKEVEIEMDKGHELGEILTVNMTGPSSPSPAQCRGLAEKTLQKGNECPLAPCSFNGVHQPSLEKTFSKEDVFIFSYFYDRTAPLGMPESFTLREMHDLAHQVCQGEPAFSAFASIPEAVKELRDRPEWCLDLNFMMALLHTGYEMPMDREVKIMKKIRDFELGWCLGASLPLLAQNSGWKCKVNEVSH